MPLRDTDQIWAAWVTNKTSFPEFRARAAAEQGRMHVAAEGWKQQMGGDRMWAVCSVGTMLPGTQHDRSQSG